MKVIIKKVYYWMRTGLYSEKKKSVLTSKCVKIEK